MRCTKQPITLPFYLSLFAFFSCIPIGQSQTLELEKAAMNAIIQDNGLSQINIKILGNQWYELMKQTGDFPDLPYNEKTEEVTYSDQATVEGISQEQLYRKIIERAAIQYGHVDQVIKYQSLKSGKVIVQGFRKFNINGAPDRVLRVMSNRVKQLICEFTEVYTITSNSYKVDITTISYRITKGRFADRGVYYDELERTYNINELYPVAELEREHWTDSIFMFQRTNKEMENVLKSIRLFLNS
ncbi:MAG: hypothetical protein P1U56_12855 [Saprospiraceae bacterium]|nr:hypothetical protein [Saprospiraceae bacterium]